MVAPGHVPPCHRGADIAAVMAELPGRAARFVFGLVLAVVGWAGTGGVWGTVIATVGLIWIAAAVLNFCVIAWLLGGPLWGRDHHL